MKKFKNFIREEVDLTANVESGKMDVHDHAVRNVINSFLDGELAHNVVTPYVALNKVNKVLANFHIFLPKAPYMEDDHGVHIFNIKQFGKVAGMRNDGSVVTKVEQPYHLYFEWKRNERGMYSVFCEVVTDEELSDLLDAATDDVMDEDDDRVSKLNEQEKKDDEEDAYKPQPEKYKKQPNPNAGKPGDIEGGMGGKLRPHLKDNVPNPGPSTSYGKELGEAKKAALEIKKKINEALEDLNPLAAARSKSASGLSQADKMHMYALTMAEVGRNDPKAHRALIETIYNRHHAQGTKSLRDTMGANYYEPLRTHTKGYQNYTKALKDLQSNPELFKQMDSRHNEVLKGSNDSNYGTQNGSAGIASGARKTQTVTASHAGETFSRKDNPAFASLHGAGTVKKEGGWYKTMSQQMQAWNDKQKGGTQVAQPTTTPKPDITPVKSTEPASKPSIIPAKLDTTPSAGRTIYNKPVGPSLPPSQPKVAMGPPPPPASQPVKVAQAEPKKVQPDTLSESFKKKVLEHNNFTVNSVANQLSKLLKEKSYYGAPEADNPYVQLKTQSGLSYTVHRDYAPRFQGLVKDLEDSGYKIRSIGGLAHRNIAGTNTPSHHSHGAAIDINADTNPMSHKYITDMPDIITKDKIYKKWGLGWGGDWTSKKDTMHFSAGPNEGGAKDWTPPEEKPKTDTQVAQPELKQPETPKDTTPSYPTQMDNKTFDVKDKPDEKSKEKNIVVAEHIQSSLTHIQTRSYLKRFPEYKKDPKQQNQLVRSLRLKADTAMHYDPKKYITGKKEEKSKP